MEDPGSFGNATVIVTGGAQGIGRATCLAFAREGANVVCGDINEAWGAELLALWKQQGAKGNIIFVSFDASSGASCKNLVDVALSTFGRIDVLFNNVGIQPKASNAPIHLLEESVWDDVFNVNIKSMFWMCKYTIPIMLQQGKEAGKGITSAIINNASVQGIHSQRGVPAYAATKGAILALTRQLACEYGSVGSSIRVNAVSPGSIMTPLAMANNKSLDYIAANTPLGCVGEPNDVAELVLFLASNKAKWITGQNFVVDGGITVKGGWAPLGEDLFS